MLAFSCILPLQLFFVLQKVTTQKNWANFQTSFWAVALQVSFCGLTLLVEKGWESGLKVEKVWESGLKVEKICKTYEQGV